MNKDRPPPSPLPPLPILPPPLPVLPSLTPPPALPTLLNLVFSWLEVPPLVSISPAVEEKKLNFRFAVSGCASHTALWKDLCLCEYIADRINYKRIVLFTKYYCPYCKRTEKLFRKQLGRNLFKYNCDVIDVTNTAHEEEIMDELERMTGARTVPRVFINGKCIGGCDDTIEAYKSGRLWRMIFP
ncbi:Glutaredoxin-1 [Taenia crassiceps]|uniref:Glutaredoxin-1 n=1 Tax=Taenia crassiceps TaxID=6207 RepID=A0ABR4QHZ6_9CEST